MCASFCVCVDVCAHVWVLCVLVCNSLFDARPKTAGSRPRAVRHDTTRHEHDTTVRDTTRNTTLTALSHSQGTAQNLAIVERELCDVLSISADSYVLMKEALIRESLRAGAGNC